MIDRGEQIEKASEGEISMELQEEPDKSRYHKDAAYISTANSNLKVFVIYRSKKQGQNNTTAQAE